MVSQHDGSTYENCEKREFFLFAKASEAEICTHAFSALEVFFKNDMRYINSRFTYFTLLYLHTFVVGI